MVHNAVLYGAMGGLAFPISLMTEDGKPICALASAFMFCKGMSQAAAVSLRGGAVYSALGYVFLLAFAV